MVCVACTVAHVQAVAIPMTDLLGSLRQLCEPRLNSYREVLERAQASGWRPLKTVNIPHLQFISAGYPELEKLYPGTRREHQLFHRSLGTGSIYLQVDSLWDPPYDKEASTSVAIYDFDKDHDDLREKVEHWLGKPPLLELKPFGDSFDDQWHDVDMIGEAASVTLVRRPTNSRLAREVFSGTSLSAAALRTDEKSDQR